LLISRGDLPSRLVAQLPLSHNVSFDGNMSRTALILLAALISVAGVAVAVGVVHTGPAAVKAAHAAFSTASPASNAPPAPQTPARAVIHFASNPQPMPAFLVNDLDGDIVSTAALHGKVVLLNFWATWCPPCRDEIPQLVQLANLYKDRLVIIGVSMDDAPPPEVKRFAIEMGINYLVVMGSREMVVEYGGVPALPTTFIINPDGGVVQKHVGLFPRYVYENEIRALLDLPINATVETFQDTGQIFLKNAALATDLPGVDFSGLTPEQKKVALKRLNSETCDCGCGLTLAQCRINDTACGVSGKMAEKVVKEVSAAPPPATSSGPGGVY
jgi:thiol-disulfide isomerase/thioredoxin